jgi:ATP-binding cassette subfamily C protein LapB
MNPQLLALLETYAMRNNISLEPGWAKSVPEDLSVEKEDTLFALCNALGWSVNKKIDQPRAHELPAFVFHPPLGWCIAESWVSDKQIRLISSRGVVELAWPKGLTSIQVTPPALPGNTHTEKAIDVFWAAILRRKSLIFDAVVATCVINVIGLATAVYSMQVYDRVIPRGGFATLFVLTSGMIFVLFIDMLIRNTRSVMTDREAGAIDSEVSEYFYARMQAVRLDARPRSVGTMAAQLRGTEQIRSMLSSASIFVLADLPFAVFFMAAMGLIGGVVILVPLAAFPLALLLAWIMARNIRKDTAASQVSGNRKNGLLVEALDAVETIKANRGGWHMLANWNRLIDDVHKHDLKVKRWSALSGSGFSLLQQLAYVGVVCVGAFEVARGNMTMGGVIACSILSGRVNGPLVAALPNLIVQWGYARSSLAALDNILTMPSDQPRDRDLLRRSNMQGKLEIEGVKFSYQGSRTGISIESLNIKPGERIGIIGPVGSGKSTLLKIMSGLYAAQEGHVLIDGVDVRQIAEEDLRQQIVYFPQDYCLITGSLRDNLSLGISRPGDDALMEVATKTGLSEFIQSHPMGLDLPISEGGSGLSSGQRVLVGLTRLLLLNPKILLLDEPTANLDQETERRIIQAILQFIKPQCTLIFVTHKNQLLTLVQRLLVIANGKIVLDGPTNAVLEKLRTPSARAPSPSKRIVLKAAGDE